EMPPQYDPAAAESRWYPVWDERGYFSADAETDREPYCIVIPPPNVTGALHVGHALGRTMEDTLIRRARMKGFEALWLPGTDHAGIATQVVVERELQKEGTSREELGRDRFIGRVWAWKGRYGDRIVEQLKRLGVSCDWSRLRFTMDDGLTRAVRVAFVRMYEDGLIYRGERLVNWCPKDQTGISDSEVQYEDVAGELVTFRYPLADGSGGFPGARSLRGAGARPRTPRRARSDRAGGAAVRPSRRALLPMPHGDRAVDLQQAVVRRGRRVEGLGEGGRAGWPHPVRAG